MISLAISKFILPLIRSYYTDKRLNDINFNHDKILTVIQSLDPNKAHDHDGVLKFGTFPVDWKKGNVVPVHKKDNKQIVNNCRPICYLYAPKF